MSTSAQPRGRTIDVLHKAQSAFGTLPSGNWTPTYIYSHGLEEKQPLEDDALLGLARTNDRDTVAPAPGLPVMQGPLVAPLDWNHIGLWLTMFFGAATVSGEDDPFTHVFTSGGEVLPYSALEVAIKSVGGVTKYMQYLGLIGSKMTIEASRAAGYQRVSMDLMGRSETMAGSSAGGTPAAAWTREAVAAAIPTFKWNDVVVANITKISATYDNKPSAQNLLNGTAYPSGYDLDQESTFTGSMDLRFANATHYNDAVANTARAGEIIFSASSDRSLSLLASAMRLERSGVPITGPAGITQSFIFRAEQSASDPMLTATLKSLVEAY